MTIKCKISKTYLNAQRKVSRIFVITVSKIVPNLGKLNQNDPKES